MSCFSSHNSTEEKKNGSINAQKFCCAHDFVREEKCLSEKFWEQLKIFRNRLADIILTPTFCTLDIFIIKDSLYLITLPFMKKRNVKWNLLWNSLIFFRHFCVCKSLRVLKSSNALEWDESNDCVNLTHETSEGSMNITKGVKNCIK